MDDLESRLEDQLSGLGRVPLAEPVPVDDLRRRARRVRTGRMLTGVVAVATAIVVTGAVVVARNGSSEPQSVQVAAPNFVLGDIDAVVLSSTLDTDGARLPLPAALESVVAGVPGVKSVSGIVDTFAPTSVWHGNTASNVALNDPTTPPRTPILFSFHNGDPLNVVSGRLPEAADEIIVDADFVDREKADVGAKVSLNLRNQGEDFHIVGTFELPGVDLSGIPLAAMSAARQAPDLSVDRLDVEFKPGANPAHVRDAIATATGSAYTVAQPSTISFPDQRLAQVEIQHAYWALLSPDAKERSQSGNGPPSAKEQANYAKYAELAKMVELRVANVAFLSSDAAALTYRIYYGGTPSPVIHEVQTGSASRVDGHWQLGTSTLCSLAALVGIKCDDTQHATISPPNGYEPLSTLEPGIVRAFTALSDPTATLAQRIAAIAGGSAKRSIISAGLEQDKAYAGKTQLTIAGWQATGPNQVNILYSMQTEGGPSTPWPNTGTAVKTADGHWYAAAQYACGISGLAIGGCRTTSKRPVAGANP